MKKILILIGKLGVIVALCLGIFLGMVYLGVFGHVFNKKELREFKNETASLVLSDDGSLIGKFFADNRTNGRFDQLPKGLVNALVATEDARYFEHEASYGYWSRASSWARRVRAGEAPLHSSLPRTCSAERTTVC